MEVLTAASFNTASVITNIGLAGAAVLSIALVVFGWKKIVNFFQRP